MKSKGQIKLDATLVIEAIVLLLILTFAAAIAKAEASCDLVISGSSGGCDNVFLSWFTHRTDVVSQTLVYSDGFSPTLASSARSFSRTGVGCGAHYGVTVTQKYADGTSCAASYGDNHNRGCSDPACGAVVQPVSVVNSADFRGYSSPDSIATI